MNTPAVENVLKKANPRPTWFLLFVFAVLQSVESLLAVMIFRYETCKKDVKVALFIVFRNGKLIG